MNQHQIAESGRQPDVVMASPVIPRAMATRDRLQQNNEKPTKYLSELNMREAGRHEQVHKGLRTSLRSVVAKSLVRVGSHSTMHHSANLNDLDVRPARLGTFNRQTSNVSQLLSACPLFEAASYSPVLATSFHNLLSDSKQSRTDLNGHGLHKRALDIDQGSNMFGQHRHAVDSESLASSHLYIDNSPCADGTSPFSLNPDGVPSVSVHIVPLLCESHLQSQSDMSSQSDVFLDDVMSGLVCEGVCGGGDGMPKLPVIAEVGETLLAKSREAQELAKLAEMVAAASRAEECSQPAPVVMRSGVYMRSLFMLSLSFFFVFAAFLPLQNLVSSLYSAGNVGTYCLSMLFMCYFVGCFFAPTVVEALHPRGAMMVCFLPILLFALSNLYPSSWTLVPASGLVGLATCTLWTAQATYITNIALLHADAHCLVFENVVANFNAIFFVAYQLAQIVGCAVSAVLLMGEADSGHNISSSLAHASYLAAASPADLLTNSTIISSVEGTTTSSFAADFANLSLFNSSVSDRVSFTSFTLNGSFTNSLFPSVIVSDSLQTAEDRLFYLTSALPSLASNMSDSSYNSLNGSVVCGAAWCPLSVSAHTSSISFSLSVHLYVMFALFCVCVITGLALMFFCLQPLGKVSRKSSRSICVQVSAIFTIFTDWRALCLLPLMFYSLVYNVFLFGDFTRAFVSCLSGVYMVGYTMIAYALLGAVVAFIVGKVITYTGRIMLFLLAFGVHMALMAAMMLWLPGQGEVYGAILLAACWGIGDGILGTLTISLLAVLFADNVYPAFAAHKLCQALGASVNFILSLYLCMFYKLLLLFVLLLLTVIGYVCLEVQLYRIRKCKS